MRLQMFGIIGASFGPICGAMTADYLLSGCQWPGPRAGIQSGGLDLLDRRLLRGRD